jgi:hypothetical protein
MRNRGYHPLVAIQLTFSVNSMRQRVSSYPMTSFPTLQERFRGCLLGGAVGDALGAPVEFLSRPMILNRFGPAGIRDYAPAYGLKGAITDDT